jgi:hypothetical protein
LSSSFPNGTVFAISTAVAAAKTITSVSNANPGVAAATANGYSDGDILILTAASTRLDQRVVRVDNAATDAFDLEGINTTSTTVYPSGFGAGSAVEVSSFVSLSQTTNTATSGGEQQYFQWVYLEDGKQRQRKTFKNARSLQWTADYDPTLAWHTALLNADEDGTTRVLLATLPNGSKIYWSVEVSFDGEPTFNTNQNQQVVATFSLVNPVSTRYAS